MNEQEIKSNNLNEQETKPNNKNNLMIVIIGVLIICIGVLAFMLIQNKNSTESTNTGIGMESNIVLGSSSKSLDEQLAEMQKRVDEGQIGVEMQTSITVKAGKRDAKLLIENPARNTKSFIVTLCLEDTGEEIYKSGIIPPNSYIEKATLNKTLKAGTYPAVAYFTTYLPDGSEDGAVGVNMTINVLN